MSLNNSALVTSSSQIDADSSKRRLKPKKFRVIKHKGQVTLPKIRKPKYFTSGHGIDDDNQRDILHEFCKYRFYSEEATFGARKQCLLQKPKANDILKRVYVKDPSEGEIFIKDIAPEYYSAIRGRPIKERFEKVKYVTNLRQTLLAKIIAGFRQDDILNLDQKYELEQQNINRIKNDVKVFSNTFDTILREDFTKSASIMNKADEITNLALVKKQELNILQRKYQNLEAEVIKKEKEWRTLKYYEMFLHSVSPPIWRSEHPLRKDGRINDADNVDLLNAYKKFYKDFEEKYEIQELIKRFNNDLQIASEPELYFTDRKEIFHLIEEAETENIFLLENVHKIIAPHFIWNETIEDIRESLQQKIIDFQEKFDQLKAEVEFLEYRRDFLSKNAQDSVKTHYKNIVVDKELLKCSVTLKEIFSEFLESSLIPDDLLDLLSGIEKWYMDELLFLDKLPVDVVKKTEKECIRRCQQEEAQAIYAAETLKRVDRTTYRLLRAITAPQKKTYTTKSKTTKRRSAPPQSVSKTKIEVRKLTQEEKDFLFYFTECFPGEDLKKYGIDLMEKPQNILQNYIGEEEIYDTESTF